MRLSDNAHFVAADGTCLAAWVVAVHGDGTVDLQIAGRVPQEGVVGALSRSHVAIDPGHAPGTCHAVH